MNTLIDRYCRALEWLVALLLALMVLLVFGNVALRCMANSGITVSAGLLLAREIWRTVSGQLRDDELVMVQESEDLAQVEQLHLDRSGTYKTK